MKNRIIELIEKHSFEDLSAEEKRFVLSELSENEFREKRSLIVQIKDELKAEADELKANKSIHLYALRAKSLEKESEANKKVGFLTFKIPLWTAIAAIFMIFILTTPIFLDNDFNRDDSQLMALVDTIYIDKIIRDTIEIDVPADTIVETIYKALPNEGTIDYISEKMNEPNDMLESDNSNSVIIQGDLERTLGMGNYPNTIDFKDVSKGKSLSNDPIGRVVLNILN